MRATCRLRELFAKLKTADAGGLRFKRSQFKKLDLLGHPVPDPKNYLRSEKRSA
jgi:hypothetical protein